ncbi:DUF1214 domain-containing protein [Mycolicibacterium confluentis]|uniref:Uncharacterized protein n=1 Tax=Mycolicibacterium confluentis TaxID=28047 RepID=A0A7I7XY16_9MYCO|nr:DUF1214 domain-containing protein [Mycolicibacterium confluentis]ORV28209.1 carboxylesterase [Mycolicibacterium confluentis]BBZ34230.1 hypothetical protein MCNF_28350 [Mycolicibacterium confluentis]
MTTEVNVDNFVAAETHRMFTDIQRDAGEINTFHHNREPAPIENQLVIRLNRDTLYSYAIADLAEPAWLTLPEAGERYRSVMVVSEDHLINVVLHDAGRHRLTQEECGSRYVLVAIRTLVDPSNPDDIAEVGRLQDATVLEPGSSEAFSSPEYDKTTFDTTREALLRLAPGLPDYRRAFGRREDVDPVHHLIGSAAAWGGLPASEAFYLGVDPGMPPGEYEMTFKDVPVDAFWSVSVYNAEGFFEANPENLYSVNSITGAKNADGSVTVRFTADGAAPGANRIVTPQGWNCLIRLYRPRAAILDGVWAPPPLTAVEQN